MTAETVLKREFRAQRLRELAEIGAGSAASALERLLGRPFRAREAMLSSSEDAAVAGAWSAAVFFEAYGDLRGVIALLLSSGTCEALARLVRPGSARDADDDPENSALCECGNIVASRTVSHIANTLAARVMLSVPTLVKTDPGAALTAWVAERRGAEGAPWIESELVNGDGDLRALLVVVPDELEPELA